MEIYNIDDNYINYLKKFESKVQSNKEESRKKEKPYIGIVMEINNRDYYIPLSSYKPKHDKMKDNVDFIKIENKQGKYAVLNINNMIPVPKEVITKINIEKEPDLKYKEVLRSEFQICRHEKKEKIFKNSKKLYHLVTVEKSQRFVDRSCNFKLLEEKCKEYKKELLKTNILEKSNNLSEIEKKLKNLESLKLKKEGLESLILKKDIGLKDDKKNNVLQQEKTELISKRDTINEELKKYDKDNLMFKKDNIEKEIKELKTEIKDIEKENEKKIEDKKLEKIER